MGRLPGPALSHIIQPSPHTLSLFFLMWSDTSDFGDSGGTRGDPPSISLSLSRGNMISFQRIPKTKKHSCGIPTGPSAASESQKGE